MITRRNFIKGSSLALASLAISPSLRAFKKYGRIVGVQLYCVRVEMKADPLGTLDALAKMGYKYVEHANYVDGKFYGYAAKEFKKVLNDYGLKMPSGHTVLGMNHWVNAKKDFTNTWKRLVDDAATMGQQYVVSPWMDENSRKNEDDFKRLLEIYNKAGEGCKKRGMKFGYHNHDFEFSEKLGGQTLYDLIMANTDPNLVIQQLDTGNLYNGGAVAKEIVSRYPGRFPSIHVKDEIPSTSGGHEKYESCILGEGIVELEALLQELVTTNPEAHLIIEQESYQGKLPLACMQRDLHVMERWGYQKPK